MAGPTVPAEIGEVEMDKCCRPSEKLGLRSGEGTNCDCGWDPEGDASSKCSRTTVFGSVRVETRLRGGIGLPIEPLRDDCELIRLLVGKAAAAYSGRSEKLSGVTTTPYVPGRCVSAFLSRSSSFVREAKEGRSSC